MLFIVWTGLACLSVQAQDVKPIDLSADLWEVLENYEKHWEAGDAQALAGQFTKDGFVLSRGRPPIRGWQDIADAYAESGGSRPVLRAYDYGHGRRAGLYHRRLCRTRKLAGDWQIHACTKKSKRPVAQSFRYR